MLEIIPKTQPQSLFTKNSVLYGALALLVGAVLLVVLFMALKNSAEGRIEEVQGILRAGKTVQERTLEKSVLGYQQKIQDFARLTASRKDATRFFPLLEAKTHPSVFFQEANLNAFEGRMALRGQATDFRSLGEQMVSFEEADEIQSLKLSDVGLVKGDVVFTLELVFNPQP